MYVPETINGKKVTKTEAKFMAKLGIDSRLSELPAGFVTNPLSGEGVTLNEVQYRIYRFIMKAQMQPWWDFMPPAQGWTKEQSDIIKDFSRGLDMFKKYWVKEYMILLD